MTNPMMRLDGEEVQEGIADAALTSLIALHDVRGARANSTAGSIYIVKPKMPGPEEAAFADRLFDRVEDLLGLPRHTIKIGVDRKSVVEGKSVSVRLDLGGRRTMKKKKQEKVR